MSKKVTLLDFYSALFPSSSVALNENKKWNLQFFPRFVVSSALPEYPNVF